MVGGRYEVKKTEGMIFRGKEKLKIGERNVDYRDGIDAEEAAALFPSGIPHYIRVQLDNEVGKKVDKPEEKKFTETEIKDVYEKVSAFAKSISEKFKAYGSETELTDLLFEALKTGSEDKLYKRIFNNESMTDDEIGDVLAEEYANRVLTKMDTKRKYRMEYEDVMIGDKEVRVAKMKPETAGSKLEEIIGEYVDILGKAVLLPLNDKNMPVKMRAALYGVWLSESRNIQTYIIQTIADEDSAKMTEQVLWDKLQPLLMSGYAEISVEANTAFVKALLMMAARDESADKYGRIIKFLEGKIAAPKIEVHIIKYALLEIKTKYFKFLLSSNGSQATIDNLKKEIAGLCNELEQKYSAEDNKQKVIEGARFQKEMMAEAMGKVLDDKVGASGANESDRKVRDRLTEGAINIQAKARASSNELTLLARVLAINDEIKILSAAGVIQEMRSIEATAKEMKNLMVDAAKTKTKQEMRNKAEQLIEKIMATQATKLKVEFDKVIDNIKDKINKKRVDIRGYEDAPGKVKEKEAAELELELLKAQQAALTAKFREYIEYMRDEGEPTVAAVVSRFQLSMGALTGVVRNMGDEKEKQYQYVLTAEYDDSKADAIKEIDYALSQLKKALEELSTIKAKVKAETKDIGETLTGYAQHYEECFLRAAALSALRFSLMVQIDEKGKSEDLFKESMRIFTELLDGYTDTDNKNKIIGLKDRYATENLPIQQKARLLCGLIAAERTFVIAVQKMLLQISEKQKEKEKYVAVLAEMRKKVQEVDRSISSHINKLRELSNDPAVTDDEREKLNKLITGIRQIAGNMRQLISLIVSFKLVIMTKADAEKYLVKAGITKTDAEEKANAVKARAEEMRKLEGFMGFVAFVQESGMFAGDLSDGPTLIALHYFYTCRDLDDGADKTLKNKGIERLRKEYVAEYLFRERMAVSQEQVSEGILIDPMAIPANDEILLTDEKCLVKGDSPYIEALQIAIRVYFGKKYPFLKDIAVDGSANTITGISDFKKETDQREFKFNEQPIQTLADFLHAINEQIFLSKQQ